LVPDGIEWRRWVRDYPVATVGIAAAAGFLVARLHGRSLVEGVSSLAAEKVSANVQNLVDDRIAETFR